MYKDKYINVLEIRTWCIDTPYTIPNPLTCYEKNVYAKGLTWVWS